MGRLTASVHPPLHRLVNRDFLDDDDMFLLCVYSLRGYGMMVVLVRGSKRNLCLEKFFFKKKLNFQKFQKQVSLFLQPSIDFVVDTQ